VAVSVAFDAAVGVASDPAVGVASDAATARAAAFRAAPVEFNGAAVWAAAFVAGPVADAPDATVSAAACGAAAFSAGDDGEATFEFDDSFADEIRGIAPVKCDKAGDRGSELAAACSCLLVSVIGGTTFASGGVMVLRLIAASLNSW